MSVVCEHLCQSRVSKGAVHLHHKSCHWGSSLCQCTLINPTWLLLRLTMQRSSVDSDKLMAFSSLKRSPLTSDFFLRSLPARSTRWKKLFMVLPAAKTLLCCARYRVKMQCEREERSFMAVANTVFCAAGERNWEGIVTGVFQHIQ